jgi:hypothetical protein
MDENELRMLENRVLRRIFVFKRDEVTGEWSKLHNEELHSLYSSPNIDKIKAGEVSGACNMRNAYKTLAVKPEGKRLLGRPAGKWKDNMKCIISK